MKHKTSSGDVNMIVFLVDFSVLIPMIAPPGIYNDAADPKMVNIVGNCT
jgi:hypothetical protein